MLAMWDASHGVIGTGDKHRTALYYTGNSVSRIATPQSSTKPRCRMRPRSCAVGFDRPTINLFHLDVERAVGEWGLPRDT